MEFHKKYLIKLNLKFKIFCPRILDEEKFFADEEKVFVECSLSIRRDFVGKFFAMCRWALRQRFFFRSLSKCLDKVSKAKSRQNVSNVSPNINFSKF